MGTQVKDSKNASSGSDALHQDTSHLKTNSVPPKDFDARQATPSELKSYGLPQRPDEKVFPVLAKQWDKIFSKKVNFITPEFKPMDELLPGLRRTHGPIDRDVANSNNSIWSGGVVLTTAADTFKSIAGIFTVPDVAPPSSTPGTYWMVSWIGIDGYGGNDVCQIGTVQYVTLGANGSITKGCYAWTEWYPLSWVAVPNFPISFGDTISVLLCINSPTQAGFNMYNETTFAHTGFTFNAPAGTTLTGNTAEWIVERPGIGGATSQLCNFGDIYFDGASASTQKNVAHNVGSGLFLNMTEGSSTVALTTLDNQTLIKINSNF
jgi:hypothetical protein